MLEEDTPLTDILRAVGVSHRRDEYTATDSAHALFAANGFLIGRYTAHEAWRDISAIRQIAGQHLPPPPY